MNGQDQDAFIEAGSLRPAQEPVKCSRSASTGLCLQSLTRPKVPEHLQRITPESLAMGNGGVEPSASGVGLTETVASVGDSELAVRRDGRLDPVPLTVGGFLEVRDHVFRSIVLRVAVEQRQVTLPNAFDSRQSRQPQVRISFIRPRATGRNGLNCAVHLPQTLARS